MTDRTFLDWLEGRHAGRASRSVASLVEEAGGPEAVAVVVVDMIEGFCSRGPLASDRIAALVEPTALFLTASHEAGVRRFYFPCDAHAPDSPEFAAFPSHCVRDTEESRLVRRLRDLPFASHFRRLDKGSVSSLIGTDLGERLRSDGVSTVICTGDCTDLCLYHLAVGLRFLANQEGLNWRIVVPQNLVATYHLGVEEALEIGALPHPGELLHRLFLYHLELNGVEVLTLS